MDFCFLCNKFCQKNNGFLVKHSYNENLPNIRNLSHFFCIGSKNIACFFKKKSCPQQKRTNELLLNNYYLLI